MSRLFLLVLVIAPALCRRGGGGGHHSSGGHYSSHASHGTHTGYNSGHAYPASGGLSGHGSGNGHAAAGAAYPPSNGLSGNNKHGYGNTGNTYHKTEIHHHHYAPPQQIHYGGSYSHPVYHGPPPTYVYQYRDSGSPFNTLLTGLALYNLGKMSAHSHNHEYREYKQRNGEVCMFEINKPNGEFRQTRIGCELMSHFIWEKESHHTQPVQQNSVVNTNTITTVTETKTNNGTMVTSTNTTTVVDALQVKGPPIQVTPEMSCFMIRTLPGYSTIREKVDCGLLQAYATSSFRNSSWQTKPVLAFIVLLSSILHFM